MYDVIEKVCKSIIQHGVYNNRIYLMKLNPEDFPDIIITMNQLAHEKSYTKIFAKIPSWYLAAFQLEGYKKEAYIPNFYNG